MSVNLDSLKAILKWSLKQQPETQSPSTSQLQTPEDLERLQWLKEALSSVSSEPSETDILKAAITVLKAYHQESLSETRGDDVIDRLLETFEQIHYLVEDLDHANDLIPLQAVDIILKYLDHSEQSLVQCACELVAVASQNNECCQRVFYSSTTKLLSFVRDARLEEGVRVKALYAVSCLTRGFGDAQRELLSNNGLHTLIEVLKSGSNKMTSKSLFFISYLYSSGEEGVLDEKLEDLMKELQCLLEHCDDVILFGYVTSLLHTLCTKYSKESSCSDKIGSAALKKLLEEKLLQLNADDDLKQEVTKGILTSPVFQ